MPNHIYHEPATSGKVQIQDAFKLIKTFESREGVVELCSSKRQPGKLRIVKSVRHTDRSRPPAEARALTMLPAVDGATHPNIIKILQVEHNAHGDFALMCFEFVQGGDLYTQLQHRKANPLFALHIFISICEALSFIHHGLVHRDGCYRKIAGHVPIIHSDIKDDNLFLRHENKPGGLPTVVLADFGLANPKHLTQPGCGCVPFMSPECRRLTARGSLTHKTDIYSTGVMLTSILDHTTKGFWPLYKNPNLLVIDRSYQGLGFTDVLRRFLVVKVKDRGDFSGFTGCGMLSSILKFREKRSNMLKEGRHIDKSYWAAKF